MADQNNSSLNQRSTPNAREDFLSLSINERIERLAHVIRHQVAQVLSINSADVEDDTPFAALNPAWEDPSKIHPVVKESVEEILERSFYTYEFIVKPKGNEERNTIRRLASYLAKTMEIPKPTDTFSDPYENGCWAWGIPEDFSGSREPNPPATFILTSARAGSTLFRSMLAGHPDLLAPPELNLLEFGSMGARRKVLDATGYSGFTSGLRHALEMTGASPEEAAQKLDWLEAEDTSIQQVYQILQDLIGQRMLVDKSPIYSLRPACLQRAEQMFDRPKYLLLVRHPYAVIESMVRMRFHNTVVGNHLGIWDENPWLRAEKWWAASYRNAVEFFKTIPSERQHTIYFETLAADPEAVLSSVCTFLGIPFHSAVMNPFAGERRLDGIGDPNLRGRDQIDPGLATVWQKKRPPQQLSPFTQVVAQELGYDL